MSDAVTLREVLGSSAADAPAAETDVIEEARLRRAISREVRLALEQLRNAKGKPMRRVGRATRVI